MKRICVFYGSSPGARPEYLHAAEQIGYAHSSKEIGLVFVNTKFYP